MKQQIWLRPDQVALINSCLVNCKFQLNEHAKLAGNSAAIMACRYTAEQIDDVLKLLVGKP